MCIVNWENMLSSVRCQIVVITRWWIQFSQNFLAKVDVNLFTLLTLLWNCFKSLSETSRESFSMSAQWITLLGLSLTQSTLSVLRCFPLSNISELSMSQQWLCPCILSTIVLPPTLNICTTYTNNLYFWNVVFHPVIVYEKKIWIHRLYAALNFSHVTFPCTSLFFKPKFEVTVP